MDEGLRRNARSGAESTKESPVKDVIYVASTSNPGTGPVDGTASNARRNIGAFCRELALRSPHVRIERRSGGGREGRYDYVIRRGIRSTSVEMPGLPLDRVAIRPGGNAWHFPRLYIDGSSWLWPYALETARSALLDYDGSAERSYEESKTDCDREFAREPRCPACGAIKERYLTGYQPDNPTDNPPYGYDRLRCLVCIPIESTTIRSIRSGQEAVCLDDAWKTRQHGYVYRVTTRRMSYEALGTKEDPICMIGYYDNRQCRLRHGHGGQCEPCVKEIKRQRVDLPYLGDT
jgi:hypothetical protein